MIITVMIDCRNFFDKPINNDMKTYQTFRKVAVGQENE